MKMIKNSSMLLKTLTVASFLSVSGILSAPQAKAYVYSFTNGTDKEINVDISGIAKFGGSMMQGNIAPSHYFKDESVGKTRRVDNACDLRGPQNLKQGETVDLFFNSYWDFGICADLTQVRVGLEGGGVFPRKVSMVPNEYFDDLLVSIDDFGKEVKEVGTDIAKKMPSKYGEVVAPWFSLTSIFSKIAKLVQLSSCKNIHFVIIPDPDDSRKVIAVTQDF